MSGPPTLIVHIYSHFSPKYIQTRQNSKSSQLFSYTLKNQCRPTEKTKERDIKSKIKIGLLIFIIFSLIDI